MFTGIIQHVGRVESITTTPSGMRIVIDPMGWDHHPKPGDSIANNGCCLTLVDPIADHGGLFTFDADPRNPRQDDTRIVGTGTSGEPGTGAADG